MDPLKEGAEKLEELEAAASGLWIPDVLQPLAQAFQDPGSLPFMAAIGIMLIIATAIMIERFYMILFVYSAKPAPLMQKIQRLILDNNIDEAVKICNLKKRAAIYQVFKSALVNADRPFDEVQDHVEVATLSVVPKLQKRLPYLFTIANVSTLLGLLGTIMGLVKTFAAVGQLEGSQKQVALSAGISLAMNTTAFGLIVAIPCMLSYGFLFNRINAFVDEIEHYSGKLLLLLRTGSEYFDHFSTDAAITTQQRPQKLNHSNLPEGTDEASYDPSRELRREASGEISQSSINGIEQGEGTQVMFMKPDGGSETKPKVKSAKISDSEDESLPEEQSSASINKPGKGDLLDEYLSDGDDPNKGGSGSKKKGKKDAA